MTLDDAIAVSRETAKVYARLGMADVASKHRQVSEWLMRSRDPEDSDEWLKRRIDALEDEVAEQRDEIEALEWDRDTWRMSAENARRENSKLRELVKVMWQDIPKSESCEFDVYAGHCTGNCKGECAFWYAMRELGIEVES